MHASFILKMLVLGLCLSCGCVTPPAAQALPGWLRIVAATTDVAWAHQVTGEMAVGLDGVAGRPAGAVAPIEVRLVRDANDLPPVMRLLGGGRVHGGWTESTTRRAWVLLPTDEEAEGRRRLRHELTHVWLLANGLQRAPWWLQEGLATCFEIGFESDGWPRRNRPRQRHVQALLRQHRCPSPSTILAKPAFAPASADEYAVAWSLVYLLYTRHGPEEAQRRLRDCLRAEPAAAAAMLTQSYGEDWQALWRREALRLGGPRSGWR